VDESSLTTLKGNVPSLARRNSTRRGRRRHQLTNMRLVLSRSAAQQSALDSYLASCRTSPRQTTTSGSLHSSSANSTGLRILTLRPRGLAPVPRIHGGTDLCRAHQYRLQRVGQPGGGGLSYLDSLVSDRRCPVLLQYHRPQIPSALAGVVMGIAHLNTIRPGRIPCAAAWAERTSNRALGAEFHSGHRAIAHAHKWWRQSLDRPCGCGNHLRHAERSQRHFSSGQVTPALV